jgi:hypothetical protein
MDQNAQNTIPFAVHRRLIWTGVLAHEFKVSGVAQLTTVLSLVSEGFPSSIITHKNAEWAG